MHLSKFASASLPELYDSQGVQNWINFEVDAFFVPYLSGIKIWSNGEDILLHGCRTAKPFIVPLLPYNARKRHTIYCLEKDAEMIQYSKENNFEFEHSEDWRWRQIDIKDWKDAEDAILPPRKVLSLHSLYAVEDYKQEFLTWFNTLFYDGKVWGTLLADSAMYKLFSFLKEHPDYQGTVGKDLVLPDWVENNVDPREAYKEALDAAGFEQVSVETHVREYTFPNIETLLETYIALSPTSFMQHLATTDEKEKFMKTCVNFLQDTLGLNSEIRYTTLVFSAVKPKPWTEILISTADVDKSETK